MGGGDKLFHKRNIRKLGTHKRKMARRDPYDMVLIVCEGEKTEPNYFRALIDNLQLNTANVKIADNTAGSSPLSVVKFAIKEYRKNREYDNVFCVIDKDQHPSYLEALDIVRRARLGKKHSIHTITSVPCFEFWVLLHFKYTTKNYYTGHGSICSKVIDDLKQYIPGYEKGDKGTFKTLIANLETAITNARKISKYCDDIDTDNPSTKIHDLILYLQNLKK